MVDTDRVRLHESLSEPNWYELLKDYLEREIFPIIHDDPEVKKRRREFYGLVKEMLGRNEIPLAENGPDWDKKRKEIDTLVIHHTEEAPLISLDGLSAIGFVRQYGKRYLENSVLRGKPIWSAHFKNDKMVFFIYHWLIRPDGQSERLLDDSHIGFHAGKLNNRSIGIALSGNYEHSSPPRDQIRTVAEIIRSHYSYVDKQRILGHREVMKNRTCPGDRFLPDWKSKLLSLI